MDKKFSELLTQANGRLDIEKPRKIFCQLEKIQQKRLHRKCVLDYNVWTISGKGVQALKPTPAFS